MKKKEKLRKGKGKWGKRNENWKGRCSNGKGRGSVSRKKYMKKGKIGRLLQRKEGGRKGQE